MAMRNSSGSTCRFDEKDADRRLMDDTRRIMIMGPPGGGKSTLARLIGAKMGLPVFHLDQAFHGPGWQPAPRGEFLAELDRIAALPAWIIDGNYTSAAASRFDAADTLIYLDMPTWLTMARIAKRILSSYGRVRPDAAPGCPERLDMTFLRFAWAWNRQRRLQTLTLSESFQGRTIILRGRAEQKRFAAEYKLSRGREDRRSRVRHRREPTG
jgi:adenylate kinase family enzyme